MTRTPIGRYNPFEDSPPAPPVAPAGAPDTAPAPPTPTGRIVSADGLDSFTQSLVDALPMVPVVRQAPAPVAPTGAPDTAPAPQNPPAHQPRRLLAAGATIVAGLLLAVAGWQLRGGVVIRPGITKMPAYHPAPAPTPIRKVLP